jgi:pyruvate,water dikinase
LAAAHATLDLVGGKGASLARLAATGFPVPPGFHVTTAAYQGFVAANDLQRVILTATAAVCAGDPASLEAAADRIAIAFTGGTIPDVIAQAIQHAYAHLGADDVALAVRSSATAEDLPTQSFAGQQETYLNIRGAGLLGAIKRCWASLWTTRAISYRARANIPAADVRLAVVVQELVPADVAGILFTANPVTGARHEVIINAAWGLGEAIVGGLVTPDYLVVDKATGRVMVHEVADKVVMTVRTPDGTHEAPVPAQQRCAPTINSVQATELVQLGVAIEQLYGRPMDIEWVICGNDVLVVQARPITTLPEPAPIT